MAPTEKQNSVWIASAGILALSIGIEFYTRACGFLFTSDSLQYLSASRSFIATGKFLSPDGSFYSYWPPLFPIILSFFSEPENALIWINIFCKTIIILVLLRISDALVKDSILKIIFLITSLLSVQMLMISVFVWSELIFMTLIFLNAYCALQLKKNKYFFHVLIITGFLACLQRNAGLFWISGVCLWMLLDPSVTLRRRTIESGACFLICTSGVWIWNIYNTFLLPADFNFYKHNFFVDLFHNLKLTLSTLGKMIVPLNAITMITGLLFFLALLLQWLLKMRENRNVQLLSITLLVYTLGYLVMPRLDVFEMDRYFSAVTPLVYLLLAMQVQQVIQMSNSRVQIAIYVIVFVWSVYPITRTSVNAKAWHDRSCSITE